MVSFWRPDDETLETTPTGAILMMRRDKRTDERTLFVFPLFCHRQVQGDKFLLAFPGTSDPPTH